MTNQNSFHLHIANCCTALDETGIGTRVLRKYAFLRVLENALQAHDPSKDRQPGQHFLELPSSAAEVVSAGVGPRSQKEEDYVVRIWRGRAEAFLRRSKAVKPTGVAAVVYTRAAYEADPDAEPLPDDVTHVLVAVLAFTGPQSPLGVYRFVKNLAGGNNEARAWSAEEIREKAEQIVAYDNCWCVVSD